MGLIQITPQTGGVPENPGTPQIIGGDAAQLSVAAGVVTMLSDIYDGTDTYSYAITYTSTAGDIPTERELFDMWALAVGAANGASGPAIQGPLVFDSDGVQIYPAIVIS